MPFTAETTLGEILDNAQAKEVLRKHFPQVDSAGPMLSMARGMSLKAVAGFPQAGITPDKLKAIIEDLAKL